MHRKYTGIHELYTSYPHIVHNLCITQFLYTTYYKFILDFLIFRSIFLLNKVDRVIHHLWITLIFAHFFVDKQSYPQAVIHRN